MPVVRRSQTGNSVVSAVVLALGLVAGGCSADLLGSSQPSGASGSSSSFKDRMNALFFGSPAKTGADQPGGKETAANTPGDVDCPGIDIRSGASTYSLGAQGADATPTTLRYQAGIARTARECAVLGATMTIKVGVQGRVILGPAGGPGQIDVPMRLALVQEGPEPKTVWTKFYRVPVTIPAGQTNVPFVQIEEDMTFPMPKADDLAAYVIYVGFDPTGDKQQPPRKKPQKKIGM